MSEPQNVEIIRFPNGRTEQIRLPANLSVEERDRIINEFYNNEVDTAVDVPAAVHPNVENVGDIQESTITDQLISDAPRMIGGIGGAGAVMKKAAQLGPVAGTALSTTAAAFGGAVGETAKTVYEYVVGTEPENQSPEDALKRIAIAGGEEGLGEGIGGMIFRGLKLAKKAATPKVNQLTAELGRKFDEFGGKFMVQQLTDNAVVRTLSDVSQQAFFSSSVFKAAIKEQQKALTTMVSEAATAVSKRSVDLSDSQLGNLFLDTARGGRQAHISASQSMYKELDALVGERMVQREVQELVNTGLVDASGKPITKVVTKVVDELMDNAPVDMRTIKLAAQDQLVVAARRGNIAGQEQKALLNTIANLDDKMLYGDAAAIRSDLLTVVREMEEKLGAGKARATSIKYEKLITDAMDDAAENSGDSLIQSQYRKSSRFYKRGKEIFDNKFIAQMIIQNKKTPEAIGAHIFSNGRYTEIKQVKKALRTAAKLDPNISYDKVWKQMQGGFIEKMLDDSASLAEGKVLTANTLNSFFVKGKKRRTMQMVLNKEQISAIEKLKNTVRKIEEVPDGSLGMAVKFGQAGLIMGALTLDAFDDGSVDKKGILATTALLFGPRVIAKAMTDPKLIKKLTFGLTTRESTKSLAAKEVLIELGTELTRIRFELDDEEQ